MPEFQLPLHQLIKCPKCDYPKVKRQLSATYIPSNTGFEPACEKQGCSTPTSFT